MKFAVIGAGITGLSVAQTLKQKGHEVKVFEKARGVGGRMSTRRADDFAFDHGAQCFTARTKPFQNFVREYEEQGVIKEWEGKVVSIERSKKLEKRIWFETHWVASPNMNSLCKKIMEDLNVNIQTEIKEIQKVNDNWKVVSKNAENLGEFDWIISTAPPEQTYSLMPDCFAYKNKVSEIEMSACFALMIGFQDKIETNWMAAKLRNSFLKWVTINSKRPDRNSDVTSIQIHSRNSWADANKDRPIEEIQKEMIDEFKALTAMDVDNADYVSTHRWLYSLVKNTSKDESYVDFDNKLAACGDWCLTSRIEDAWISGQSAINKICEAA